jgi:hypothetical protein
MRRNSGLSVLPSAPRDTSQSVFSSCAHTRLDAGLLRKFVRFVLADVVACRLAIKRARAARTPLRTGQEKLGEQKHIRAQRGCAPHGLRVQL